MLQAKKVYRCPHDQCSWEFSCASKLRRHLGSHTKQKNHLCPECGRGFKTSYNVQYHVRTIHQRSERPYKCPVRLCKVTCTSTIQLHLHFKTDHPKNALFCCSNRDCYASFLSKDEYLVHQLTHKQAAGSVAAEIFSCDFCKAVLPTKSKLCRHRMFHIGEKHFRCPIKNCGHAYFTKQHLLRHLQQGDHLKGSIINCPKCSRIFLDQSLLDHHSIVHSSNDHFKCPYKSCDGVTMCNEGDYCSHLISAHSDTPWLPCVVTTTEKCKHTFPNKELQNLHRLLYHQYSTDTLKHLSSVKYDISKIKKAPSFVGSKEDFAIIRLIVRLYPYLRSFKIPIFDPYLASITLFINAATITCADLDKVLTSLSLSEIETKATVNGLQMEGMKGNRDTCLQPPSLSTSISSLIQLQTKSQPDSEMDALSSNLTNVPSSTTAVEDMQQVNVPAGNTSSTSSQRPLLLSMPLLTDLQPPNVDQLPPLSCNDTVDNNNTEVASSDLNQLSDNNEIASTNIQDPYSNLMFLDDNGVNNNISNIFDTLPSSAANATSGNPDFDNPAILSDDILDLANDPQCVRELMESVELSYLLPDFLESSSATDWANLTMLDNDSAICSSNEAASDIPNFAHLSNPLADLTFESLSAIPDSILESTLQMMIENPQSSSDILIPSPDVNIASSSTAKGKASGNVNKRGSTLSQKQRKALQLAKV